ncbi:helix-turn-helix domain-containing protein [Paenibacillus sp. 11B]|uniref:helix-turn-helix domain-containing protein n=1 Tax=Paenibacillus sp. 11B TaxID=3060965 RepID=UPI0034621FD1
MRIPIREQGSNVITEYKSTTSASISNIEKDRHRPSLDMAIALCEHFNVTLDWLILGKGESTVHTPPEPEVTIDLIELKALIRSTVITEVHKQLQERRDTIKELY